MRRALLSLQRPHSFGAVSIEDSQALLRALGAMAGTEGQCPARAELFSGCGFERAAEVLVAWAHEA
jgi:hypothetical protein